MNELISVIVPVYNVEKYLLRCVKSLLDQTYKNIEIILVNDGSTDDSGAICDSLLNVDSRIKVYHKENGGLSSARNYGIKHSKGTVLAFIDSDDIIHESFFEVLMDARDQTEADIVSTDMILFSSEKDIVAYNKEAKLIVLKDSNILHEYFAPEKKRMYIYHGLCMKIYNTELFSGLKFEEGRFHEDLYITYKLLDRAKVFCFIDLPYYYYFQNNEGSICKNFGKKNYFDQIDAFAAMENFFKNNTNIKSSFTHFLIFQYLDLINRGRRLKNNDVDKSILQIKKWILKNIKWDEQIGLTKRVVISLMLMNMGIYNLILKK